MPPQPQKRADEHQPTKASFYPTLSHSDILHDKK